MSGVFARFMQLSHRKKSMDSPRNGQVACDRRQIVNGARNAQGKAAENFLQAFEKPTQIYRYIMSHTASNAPIFLHRTLSYMKQRMSRTHQRRAGFRVDSMLDRIMSEIDVQSLRDRRDLTLHFTSFDDPLHANGKPGMALISASVVSVHQPVPSSRRTFCDRRADEQEIRKVLMSMEKEVPVTSKTRDSTGSKSGSVRMLINKDVFPKMSRDFVKCILLITARPKYNGGLENRGSAAQLSPDSKRRKKGEAAAAQSLGPVFKSEMVVFNSRMECQLVSGTYQVLPKPEEKPALNKTFWIGNAADVVADISSSQINNEAKVNLKVVWNDVPKPVTPAARSANGFLNFEKKQPPTEQPCKVEDINIIYQFFRQNEYQETTMKLHNFKCPWCNLNCLVLKSFASHLKHVHPRFHFRVRYEVRGSRTDVQVDVSLNESFDGSYSGNPQDLSHTSCTGIAFSRNGPMRRNPVTIVLVNKKAVRHDSGIDSYDEDIEPLRPTIHGHDRLYYHTNTCIPIRPQDMEIDSEDENDPQWMRYKTQQMIDEFSDVNDGEKEVMKLWNLHIMKYGFTGDCQIPEACRIFLEERGEVLREKNLRSNFILHLMSLYDYGLIDAVQKAALIRKLNGIFSRSFSVVSKDHPVLMQNMHVIPNGFRGYLVP